MITFTQSYTRVLDIIGANSAVDTTEKTNIIQDINQAVRLFNNVSRRYVTRKEVTTNLVANQQYYTFPEDMVRITKVKANTGAQGYNWPLEEIDSEQLWNKLNVIPSNTVITPQFYFVRGKNEIGLYPTPSTNVTAGLIVSYEPRQPDMSIDDTTTTTVTVTNGSQSVTSPSTPFASNMVGMMFSVTDGTDGNWYPIIGATATTLTLENYYQGITENTAPCIIGSVPAIQEEFQMAVVYFSAYNLYLKRNEMENATLYKSLYEDLYNKYVEAYAAKSTGLVQKPMGDNIYNVFWVPPGTIT